MRALNLRPAYLVFLALPLIVFCQPEDSWIFAVCGGGGASYYCYPMKEVENGVGDCPANGTGIDFTELTAAPVSCTSPDRGLGLCALSVILKGTNNANCAFTVIPVCVTASGRTDCSAILVGPGAFNTKVLGVCSCGDGIVMIIRSTVDPPGGNCACPADTLLFRWGGFCFNC